VKGLDTTERLRQDLSTEKPDKDLVGVPEIAGGQGFDSAGWGITKMEEVLQTTVGKKGGNAIHSIS